MVALAFLAGLPITLYYAKIEKIKREAILDLFMYSVVSSIIGARLFYVIGFFGEYRDNPLSIFYFNQGGLVFLGGIFVGAAVVLAYTRIHKISLWKVLDIASPPVAIGYAIGRVGCLLNGCCYGITAFGVQQPTQIYSSLAGVIIFIIIINIYRKKRYDGQIFLWWALLYSIYRFDLEFIRYNPLHVIGLTVSQLLVVPMFIFAGYMLWKKRTT
jgi:phosphatidylglycerol:prolipoprotein diacylglycerol transferase